MESADDLLDVASNPTPHPEPKQTLPNAGGVLTLGILSLIFIGLLGLIMGIISVSLSGKALEAYRMNPDKYTESSYKNVNAGKICGIIGMSISGLALIIIIVVAVANA